MNYFFVHQDFPRQYCHLQPAEMPDRLYFYCAAQPAFWFARPSGGLGAFKEFL